VSTDVLGQLVARSRTIGADPSLVVWGGGNTSAKGELVDHLGRVRRVMWIKGSGSDLASATPADFPALYLDELVALRELDSLDDDTMVDHVARAIVDPAARRPSIETLLHAFIPAAHIDHVHADAICTLTNHRDGAGAVKEALGDRFAYVDWIRPGFALSKVAGDLAGWDGIVLAHHGLVTWADSSDGCLARTLAAVARVEAYLDSLPVRASATARSVPDVTRPQLLELLLRLRGHLNDGGRRVLRVDRRLRAVADRADVDDVARAGVSTGDHMMRIKPWSAVLTEPTDGARTIEDVDRYAAGYRAYFDRHRADLLPDGYSMHDPRPKVLLVPGLGAITTGADLGEAEVLADIALHTHTVGARVLDHFEPSTLPDPETFAFDYWPMELYKLTRRAPAPPFAGTVIVVTGAASGIGRGIARSLGSLGASLCLADLDADGLAACADELIAAGAPAPIVVAGDQSDEAIVTQTLHETVLHFGGADGLVACAGVGVTGALSDLTTDVWERSLRVNLTSAFLLTRHGMRSFAVQGSGGAIVYVASKNAFAPGSGFGAYSVAKAGMLQLMRIAALEGGPHGVRANAVNPDAVFDGSRLWDDGIREERAAAHGVDPDELEAFYSSRNLLGRRVTSSDVARAVAFLLSDDSSRTTGAVIAVDGGVPGAFPR
jgi:rhamnulose-1-phosphate aldolase/alcohol dehydrogenase